MTDPPDTSIGTTERRSISRSPCLRQRGPRARRRAAGGAITAASTLEVAHHRHGPRVLRGERHAWHEPRETCVCVVCRSRTGFVVTTTTTTTARVRRRVRRCDRSSLSEFVSGARRTRSTNALRATNHPAGSRPRAKWWCCRVRRPQSACHPERSPTSRGPVETTPGESPESDDRYSASPPPPQPPTRSLAHSPGVHDDRAARGQARAPRVNGTRRARRVQRGKRVTSRAVKTPDHPDLRVCAKCRYKRA